MKSILIGLLLFNSTAFCQSYIRTDSTYCLELSTARKLVAEALRSRVLDTIAENLSKRVDLLETQQAKSYSSFTNLLKIEQEKLQLQKEITLHTESISNTYQEEKKSLKKQVRRLKWQRAGLAAVAVLVTGLSL